MKNLPPSDHGFDFSIFIEWGLLIGVLIFLFYTAKKIQYEKIEFLDDATWTNFFEFKLPIPKWWSMTEEHSKLVFHRTDTRYDWVARFSKEKSEDSVDEFILSYLENNKIVLDNSYDSYEKTVNSEYLILDQEVNQKISEFVRYEATATVHNLKRAYFDLIAFRGKDKKSIFFFESRSSILNGCVEGPYFEESIKNLKSLN